METKNHILYSLNKLENLNFSIDEKIKITDFLVRNYIQYDIQSMDIFVDTYNNYNENKISKEEFLNSIFIIERRYKLNILENNGKI